VGKLSKSVRSIFRLDWPEALTFGLATNRGNWCVFHTASGIRRHYTIASAVQRMRAGKAAQSHTEQGVVFSTTIKPWLPR
jgi:hypothetical protein